KTLLMFDLPVFQFHRHRPAENCQFHPHQALGLQDLLDLSFHAGKGAVLDLHAVAAIELGLGVSDSRHLFPLPAEHALHFMVGHWLGGMMQGAADKVPHSRGVSKQIKDAIVVLDLDHQVSGIELALAHHAFAVAHLGYFFHGNDDLAETLLETFDLDFALD